MSLVSGVIKYLDYLEDILIWLSLITSMDELIVSYSIQQKKNKTVIHYMVVCIHYPTELKFKDFKLIVWGIINEGKNIWVNLDQINKMQPI